MLIIIFLVLKERRTKSYIKILAKPATKIPTCEIVVRQATNACHKLMAKPLNPHIRLF